MRETDRPMSTSPPSRLDVVHRGRGGPLVVFVHGVLDRGQSFERVAEALGPGVRFRWYDRRGYGGSLDAPGAPVEVAGHIDDLLEVLDGQRAVLVGHSFGGVTAIGAALRAPELVQALVLYETGMAWVPGWDDRVLQGLLWGENPEVDGARLMFRDRWHSMSEDQRNRRVREARAFVAEERSVRVDGPPFDLRAVQQPVVFGCSDRYIHTAVPRHLQRVMPRVEVVVLPGADHNAHRSQPAAFADLIRRAMAAAAPHPPVAGPTRARVVEDVRPPQLSISDQGESSAPE
jgi:pimeloyl-ACP methyl ester carboxylesterase